MDGTAGNDTIDAGGDPDDVCIVDDDPNNGENGHTGCDRVYHIDTTDAGPANNP